MSLFDIPTCETIFETPRGFEYKGSTNLKMTSSHYISFIIYLLQKTMKKHQKTKASLTGCLKANSMQRSLPFLVETVAPWKPKGYPPAGKQQVRMIWWFQPIWNICLSIWIISPRFGVEIWKLLETTTLSSVAGRNPTPPGMYKTLH